MGKKNNKKVDLDSNFSPVNYENELKTNQIVDDEYSIEEDIQIDNFSKSNVNKNKDYTKIEDVQEKIVMDKPKKSINELSKSEYRHYLRTGIIPN